MQGPFGVEIIDHQCGPVFLALKIRWPLDSSLVFVYRTFWSISFGGIHKRISFIVIAEDPLRVRTMLVYHANSLSLTR